MDQASGSVVETQCENIREHFYHAMLCRICCGKITACLSICHTPVLCRNGSSNFFILSSNFFTIAYPHHSTFSRPNVVAVFRWDPLEAASNAGSMKTSRFLTNISFYLGNGRQQELVCDLSNDAIFNDLDDL